MKKTKKTLKNKEKDKTKSEVAENKNIHKTRRKIEDILDKRDFDKLYEF
ncbi:adenosine deaminase [Photobacterium ganghwense]|nr:adenosine deaminase [Photobacterium ganghwense]PSU10795.1 adenosine deaminase [Photobacterium ganghwense]QSV12894.1 adenosine deaminase [Photobacterium ganghwense]